MTWKCLGSVWASNLKPEVSRKCLGLEIQSSWKCLGLDAADVLAARQLAQRIVIAPTVKDYAIRLVLATHPGGEFEIAAFRNYIRVGASPRAAQALVTAAKVFALMDGRFAVSLADVRRVALPALRHPDLRSGSRRNQYR